MASMLLVSIVVCIERTADGLVNTAALALPVKVLLK
jgi:hypothetical protein